MSRDNPRDTDDFLARWSRRKDEIARAETDAGKQADNSGAHAPPQEMAEEPFDFSLLPKLEDITGDTDISLFMHRAVPDDMRNAALRRVWHLNETIRDYVDPAMEYAWDWNTPGMSPGEALEAGYDAARQIAGMLSNQPDHTLVENENVNAGLEQARAPAAGLSGSDGHTATQQENAARDAAPALASSPVRRGEDSPPSPSIEGEIAPSPATRDLARSDGGAAKTPVDAATQQVRRRHGGASPA